MKKPAKKKQCIIKGCKCPVLARGVCSQHYSSVNRAISKGTLTDAEAVERGLWLPKSPVRESERMRQNARIDALDSRIDKLENRMNHIK